MLLFVLDLLCLWPVPLSFQSRLNLLCVNTSVQFVVDRLDYQRASHDVYNRKAVGLLALQAPNAGGGGGAGGHDGGGRGKRAEGNGGDGGRRECKHQKRRSRTVRVSCVGAVLTGRSCGQHIGYSS